MEASGIECAATLVTNELARSRMGYFDALTSSYFKTEPDGRRLFFPWGVLGRGYVLASERDYERLRGQLKAYTIVTLILTIGAAALHSYVGAIIVGVALIAFYLVWAQFLLRGLPQSDERLSLEESMTSQGLAHNAAMLWLLEILSLVFVAAGLFILSADPDNWLMGLFTIVFFGLCALALARMLLLRSRRAAR